MCFDLINTLNKSPPRRSSKAHEGQFLYWAVTLSVTMYSQLRCVRTFRKCPRVFAVVIVAKATAWAMYVMCYKADHKQVVYFQRAPLQKL